MKILFIILFILKKETFINNKNGVINYKDTKLKKWLEGIPEYHYHG